MSLTLTDSKHEVITITPPSSYAVKLGVDARLRDGDFLLSDRPPRRVRKICCIGAGYVGGPTCAVIAHKIPNIEVTVADFDAQRIQAWQSAILPIYEPNLAEIAKPARDGFAGRKPNLFFTTDVSGAIAAADLIFVSVNTPTKLTGTGAGRASDLTYIEAATRQIAEASTSDKIVVEKSTVPVKTAKAIHDILRANGKPGVRFDVLSNPEFLAEGTAISNLLNPDRVLIGSLPASAHVSNNASVLEDIYAEWVPRERIISIGLWSSELAKLTANALLAQRISSINSISAICEATGADVNEVAFAAGLDRRIGSLMLKPSVGFGGSCFKKDVLSLVYLAESMNLPEVAAYWKSVVDINEWQKERFVKRIISCLFNTLTNKRVAILGFAYKKNTGDTRESASISIIKNLMAERADMTIYDPQVSEEQIWRELGTDARPYVSISTSAYDACRGAHAVVILTEWDEFRGGQDGKPGMDWSAVAKVMLRPMFVFDGRNVVDVAKLENLGFQVECVGKAGRGEPRT